MFFILSIPEDQSSSETPCLPGTPVTSKEFYSLRNGMVLHGEPIYEENDVERANPVGMRYYYTTNDVNHSQNCWIAINWADASTFESIIGW